MATQTKERGRLVGRGMGGFLNPPGHPEHTYSIETELRRRKENRGGMSLLAAEECEWLDDATRAMARAKLAAWEPLPLTHHETVAWVRQVLGYFRGCYKGYGGEPECWHASNLRIVKDDRWEMEPVDQHAGVHLIRRYYPKYEPSRDDFANARWGT